MESVKVMSFRVDIQVSRLQMSHADSQSHMHQILQSKDAVRAVKQNPQSPTLKRFSEEAALNQLLCKDILPELFKETEDKSKLLILFTANTRHNHSQCPMFHTCNHANKLDEKPEIQELLCFKYLNEHGEKKRIHIIDEISSKWDDLGSMLNFTMSNIKSIMTTCQGEVERSCKAMLSQWLEGRVEGNITWKALIEAMEDVRLGELAERLKKTLLECNKKDRKDCTCTF